MRLVTSDESATVHYARTLWTELTSLCFLDGPGTNAHRCEVVG